MFEVAIEAWTKEQELNVLQWNQRYLILNEDGCCHNAGHNPEYLSYSLFDQNLKKNNCFVTYTINRGLWVFQSNGKSITDEGARKGERKAVENHC